MAIALKLDGFVDPVRASVGRSIDSQWLSY
jgi:hypothetical protein